MQVVPSIVDAAGISTIVADIIGVVGATGTIVAAGIAIVVGVSGMRLNGAPSRHR